MLAVVVMVGLIPAINVSTAGAKPVIRQKTMVLFLKEASYSWPSGGKYTVEPKGYLNIANGAGKQKWTSSNKKVETVSQHGTVTGKKKGTATITCTTGGKKLTCKVTVKDMPSKITKGISVSYKKVKNYVVATYKNTLAYPVLIPGGIVQYDKDGKKIENFGMQNTASIRVSAKSSVKFYIMLADNCSYYEK